MLGAYAVTRSFLSLSSEQESKSETYERMWQAMSGSLADSNADGVSRVQAGGYAFLMESTTIEYVVERNCQLTQVGGLLDSKGYGIAMPAGKTTYYCCSGYWYNVFISELLNYKEIWYAMPYSSGNVSHVCKTARRVFF